MARLFIAALTSSVLAFSLLAAGAADAHPRHHHHHHHHAH